jgi:hypothetical protein
VEQPVVATESLPREETMETETRNDSKSDASDVLLDLGELEPVSASSDDDFVLDLEEDAFGVEVAAQPAYKAAPMRTFVEPQVKEAVAAAGAYESTYQPEVHSSFADTQEVPYAAEVNDVAVVDELEPAPMVAEPEPVAAAPATSILSDQLSPEMIEAIARRVVEMMSDKVVREIAWEVVPDMAELLIKRQLEEKPVK